MKRILMMVLSTMLILTATSCKNNKSDTDKTPVITKQPIVVTSQLTAIPKDKLKVGFVYNNFNDQSSFIRVHEQGRKELERMGIKTVPANVIPSEDATGYDTIKKLIVKDACNVVYVTSADYEQTTTKIANEFPAIYFNQFEGTSTANNLSTYSGKMYEVRYLAGIVAGKKTKTNKIGYVAAKPVGQVIRQLNAFTLGVQSVNPKATVEVMFTNNWFSPIAERQSSLNLVKRGADVIAQHQDTDTAQITAADQGVFVIGQNYSTAKLIPNSYLTGCLYDFSSFYKDDLQQIMGGDWHSRRYVAGIGSGVVKLEKLSNSTADTDDLVQTISKKLESGELNPFSGPIKDTQGNIKIPSGQKLTDDAIQSMDWFVDGVKVIS